MRNDLISNAPVTQIQDRPEADYIELERLSVKLGIPVPQVFLTVSVSKGGKVVSTHRQRARTWNRNYWNYLIACISGSPVVVTNFGAGYLSLKQLAGTVAAIPANAVYLIPDGAAGNSSRGIIAGRGAGAEDFEGYVLTTPIANGTGANQMTYAGHSALVQAYNAGTKLWTVTLKRVLTNTSGGAIDVTETGISYYYTALGSYVMFCRDLLAAAVNVPNNQTITIAYDITLTFPA